MENKLKIQVIIVALLVISTAVGILNYITILAASHQINFNPSSAHAPATLQQIQTVKPATIHGGGKMTTNAEGSLLPGISSASDCNYSCAHDCSINGVSGNATNCADTCHQYFNQKPDDNHVMEPNMGGGVYLTQDDIINSCKAPESNQKAN